MKQIFVIAINTYRESVRSQVIYTVLFFAAAIVLASSIFASVSVGDKIKVIKDFGLASISIFSVAFTIISGSSLLYKELNKKTIYNILSKPINRWQFILGKHLGLVLTTTMLSTIMGLALMVYLYPFESRLDLRLLMAIVFSVFELTIVSAITILFSSIVVTISLAGLFTFVIFLAGRSAEYILMFAQDPEITPNLSVLLKILYCIIPQLQIVTVQDEIVYGSAIVTTHIIWSLLYTLSYSSLMLVIASWCFAKKEFN